MSRIFALVFNNQIIRVGNFAITKSYIDSSAYVIYIASNSIYRKGVRDGAFVLDVALNEIGFDGTENVDWEKLNEIKKPT